MEHVISLYLIEKNKKPKYLDSLPYPAFVLKTQGADDELLTSEEAINSDIIKEHGFDFIKDTDEFDYYYVSTGGSEIHLLGIKSGINSSNKPTGISNLSPSVYGLISGENLLKSIYYAYITKDNNLNNDMISFFNKFSSKKIN